MIERTKATLADGRDIFFFDEAPYSRPEIVDPRSLPSVSTETELRYDPLLDEWVIIASHRQHRTHLPPSEECPLCPSTDGRQTEIPTEEYDVVVFENRFPSLTTAAQLLAPDGPSPPTSTLRPGFGRCEVVCFTSDHDASFSALTPTRTRTVVEAWVDRTEHLSGIEGIELVFPFENRGSAIGVTLHHPHGQIYGYPFVPPHVQRMLHASQEHLERTGENLFATTVSAERASGARIIAETRFWTAFVPAAARWPLEVHLYPNRQIAALPGLSEDERDDFSHLYLEILRRFEGVYEDEVPYIAAWYQSPVNSPPELWYLHLRLISNKRAANKLKYLAGSEIAMGVFINDVPPERIAEVLRGR